MPISKLEVSVSDLAKRPRVQITQGDRRSRVIEATVTDGGSPMDLTGKRARFRAELPLGKVVIDDGCEVADAEAGVIRYTVGDEVAARAAVISDAYFEIYDEEGYSLAASKMVVEVGRGVDVDGERPGDYVPELDRLKAELARIAEEAKIAESERASEFEAVKADAERATRAADEAAYHQPRIGGSGTWETWDAASGAYADTGTRAQGPQGERGERGPQGDTGPQGPQGPKGDKLAYADLTEADKAELQKPAVEAAQKAEAAIAEVKATEAKLYPAAENVLVGSEAGTVAHVDDAFNGATLRGITVEGACKQDGTPSPEAPVPIGVVEHPVVRVTGRNLWPFASSCSSIEGHQNEFVKDGTPFTLLPGEYTFSAVGSLGNTDAPLFGYTAAGKRIQLFRIMRNVANPRYGFTVTEPITSIYFVSNAADSTAGTISNIQLERNSTATEYKPHTSQSLAFTLPAEHPYLAKLPDGTADTIEVDEDGNVELVARVERVLPIDQPLDFGDGGDGSAYASLRKKHARISANSLMCSSYTPSNPTIKSGFIYTPNYTNIVIRDDRFTSKEKAIELLDGVVVYVAVEPTRYPLGKIDMPKAQDSIVNAWTDAEVTPNTGIEYVRDVNIVVANLESAIASIS